MHRRLLALALGAVALGAGAGPAHAAARYRWSHLHVSVRNYAGWPEATRMAIGWWNALPSRLRLVPARGGRHADVRIVRRALPGDIAGEGWYPPSGLVEIDSEAVDSLDLVQRAEIIAHEIGHALGLPHLRPRCSLMHAGSGLPSLGDCDSSRLPDGEVYCGPQPPDLQALVVRYGGRTDGFGGTICQAPSSGPGPDEPPYQPPPYQPPPAAEVHDVSIVLSQIDDVATVTLDGVEVGSARVGETTTIPLGALTQQHVIDVDVDNEDGAYSWRIGVVVDGTTVLDDAGSGLGGDAFAYTTVHSIELDGFGNELGSYTAQRAAGVHAPQP